MLTKEEALKWADALESGEFKQERGRYKRVNKRGEIEGYCCLGVACVTQLGVKPEEDSHIFNAVAKREIPFAHRYIDLNDNRGFSFASIAAEIRKDYAD